MSGSNIYLQGWPCDNVGPEPTTNTSIVAFLHLNIQDNTISRRKKFEYIHKAWITTAVTEYIQVESTFRSNAHGAEA